MAQNRPPAKSTGSAIRSRLTYAGIVLGIVLFMALNLIAAETLRSARLDLTETRLYSLSEGTRALLEDLDEPLHLRFFLSSALTREAPQLAAYAARVRALLDTYADLAGGAITLETIDPAPFSAEEDRAVGLGVERIQLADGDAAFFGLAATNSTDGQALIPVFTPTREPFLEYDLTRLVAELGQTAKPRLALFDGIGLTGVAGAAEGGQESLRLLRELYEVDVLQGDVDAFADGTRVVVVVHASGLSERTLYTLDQWVLAGGAALLFLDPAAEALANPAPGGPQPAAASDLGPLLDAWGVGFDVSQAVADPTFAIRTVRQLDGREVEVSQPTWLALSADAMDTDDASLSQLSSLILTTAGAFETERDDVALRPLFTASGSAGFVDARGAADPFTDPRDLLIALEPAPEPPILGARLSGSLESAFADGPPAGAPDNDRHRSALEVEANVILVADADLLMDRNWIQQQQLFGQVFAQAFANNGDFLLNAVEQMAGGAALADLRGRAIAYRPFERIDALERAADARYLETEQALLARIQEVETQLRETAPQAADDAALVSAEKLAAAETLRADLLRARAELRDVQFELRRDVKTLETTIVVLLVGVVPALVTLLTLLLVYRRPNAPVPSAGS